ncbi:7TM-DISM domain-containing protein [Terrimonas pollutisoli]|uniref:7TM-DISM domain-containing protein n=1 Tax=Terrimonas pollutisoli TaxID=3034147 RepID=UPI0023EAEE0E|nr:7TM-DISM domain-containing protein [Terrimonas sp. H1YJ31]
MKKSLFLCVHILFLAAEVWSQNYPLPVFEISNDTADFHEINNRFWQILEDPGGKLSIDEVSNPSFSHNFHPDSSSLKGVDNSQHIYWFRMSLRNKI